jgi:hypothetical protein
MKPLRSLAALAIAGLLCAGGVAATAMPAAATAGAHASASSAVEPLHANALVPANAACPYHSGYFTTYYNGCVHWTNWACVSLHHFNISPPNYVSNDCPQAVQLWSGQNETGHAICIGGLSRSGYLHTAWHSFRITGSGTCLALSRSSAGSVTVSGWRVGVGPVPVAGDRDVRFARPADCWQAATPAAPDADEAAGGVLAGWTMIEVFDTAAARIAVPAASWAAQTAASRCGRGARPRAHGLRPGRHGDDGAPGTGRCAAESAAYALNMAARYQSEQGFHTQAVAEFRDVLAAQ